ncbi:MULTISPECIES: arsenate reductase family protein [Anaerofustis]|uniref:arsenate reductase family protein n=1 Tax=Anaerofustis TaxID=264995 RepID=UPI0011066532|nr:MULTISPECIES: arsenate reductase family protein [Anaerofustis]MCO8194607.1 arsenate reductase family protein [Anaerofustis sp. NSJ-163]
MKYLFLEYPKCSTCKKAKKWLIENDIDFTSRHIIENNPTKEELTEWIKESNLPIKRFFNTSGMKYRELNLKDKLKEMNEDEMISLLSTDGMLVKRPIIIGKDKILTGFKEKEWEEYIK